MYVILKLRQEKGVQKIKIARSSHDGTNRRRSSQLRGRRPEPKISLKGENTHGAQKTAGGQIYTQLVMRFGSDMPERMVHSILPSGKTRVGFAYALFTLLIVESAGGP